MSELMFFELAPAYWEAQFAAPFIPPVPSVREVYCLARLTLVSGLSLLSQKLLGYEHVMVSCSVGLWWIVLWWHPSIFPKFFLYCYY